MPPDRSACTVRGRPCPTGRTLGTEPVDALEAPQAQVTIGALGRAAEGELFRDTAEVADIPQAEPVRGRLGHDDRVRILGGRGFQGDEAVRATTRVSASWVSSTSALPVVAPSVRNESAEPAYSGTRSTSPSARAGWTSSLGPAHHRSVGKPRARRACE